MRNLRIKIISALGIAGAASYIGYFLLDHEDGPQPNTPRYSDTVSLKSAATEPVVEAINEADSSDQAQDAPFNGNGGMVAGLDSNAGNEVSRSIFETWNSWIERLTAEDFYPSDLEERLIAALRQNPSQEIYDDLYQIFLQDEVSVEAKQLILSLLGEVATVEAAQSLYQLISDGLVSNESLKKASIRVIRNFAIENWSGEPNFKIASFMEDEWDYIRDSDILSATAITLAQIGRRSTLELFSKELNTDDINNSLDIGVVQRAMSYIRNPELVADLSSSLNAPSSELLRDSSAVALANIGTVESSEALLDWSTRASAADAERIQEWFKTAVNKSPSTILVLEKHLPTQKFDSDEVKDVLQNTLYEAYRNTLPD